MVIIINSRNDQAPELFRTKAPTSSSDKITGAFFDQNSFDLDEKANWVTNYSGQREGGFKQRFGSKDKSMSVLLHLTGTTRFVDLATWRSIAGGTVLYFNSDIDSNLDHNYIITRFKPRFLPTERRLEIRMTWEQENND